MKKISDIQQSALSHIFQKLAFIKETQSLIQPYLPEELRAHCQVANFENGVLTLVLTSSIWATKLQYCLPDLLSALRTQANLPHLASIKYYIDSRLNIV